MSRSENLSQIHWNWFVIISYNSFNFGLPFEFQISSFFVEMFLEKRKLTTEKKTKTSGCFRFCKNCPKSTKNCSYADGNLRKLDLVALFSENFWVFFRCENNTSILSVVFDKKMLAFGSVCPSTLNRGFAGYGFSWYF